MKRLYFIFSILFLPVFLMCQSGREYQPDFINVKWAPTSLLNFNTPVLLVGVEFWPSEKINIQYEYGHKSIFFIKEKFNENKEEWFYQKHKFGFRYHYFPSMIQNNWWTLGRRSLLPFDRRSYVGLDFIYFPQTFRDYDDRVYLENGTVLQYPVADVQKDAAVVTMVFGSQMKISHRFFWEVYVGVGAKFLNMQHDFDPARATVVFPTAGHLIRDFSFEKQAGRSVFPFIDLGVKIGFEILHR